MQNERMYPRKQDFPGYWGHSGQVTEQELLQYEAVAKRINVTAARRRKVVTVPFHT